MTEIQIAKKELDEIRAGVCEYEKFLILKSSFSEEQIAELKKEFKVEEIHVSDEIIENGIDNLEELGKTERWHYVFSQKKTLMVEYSLVKKKLDELREEILKLSTLVE